MSGKNKMHVCKAFYQQFEWAYKPHWEAVSEHPVLICVGDDDKVTPIRGAQALHRLLLSLSTEKEINAGCINTGSAITENTKEENCSSSPESASLKSSDSAGRVRFSVIKDAGHHVLEEQPEQLASLMNSFFYEACGLSSFGEAVK
jgi:pimeloyl-ACP methyl ester carboxylesterase